MIRKIRESCVLLGVLVAVVLGLALPANAGDGYATIRSHVTCASNSGILWGYHTQWGTTATQMLSPCDYGGEVNGNYAYEPESFYVGPHWCATYWWQLPGGNPVKHTAVGGANGAWTWMYFGDGYVGNYDMVAESWYCNS